MKKNKPTPKQNKHLNNNHNCEKCVNSETKKRVR